VLTGLGMVTALGIGWKQNSIGFRNGRRAFRPVTLFDASRQRAKTAAEVDLPATLPSTLLSRKQEKRLDRAARLLLLAANEAWQQAGWSPDECLPVILGTTSGGMAQGEAYYRQATQTPSSRQQQPTRCLNYVAQRPGSDLAEAFGFHGPITNISNACASGSNAIGHAWDQIRRGRAKRVLTGGFDTVSHLVFAGFDSLQALSTTQCRPFDSKRDGLALGEGAAVLCLESLQSAEARGANILGEIIGYGCATDCHHLTQPHPQGNAALQSMQAAVQSAGINPAQIGYINAHGTGTPLNDVAEALAINAILGEHASQVPVSSTKASVGHLLGAAGAVEAAICLMVLREQWLPPTATLEEKDSACRFPIITKPTDAEFEYALSNSFGFGGANATLVFRRWP